MQPFNNVIRKWKGKNHGLICIDRSGKEIAVPFGVRRKPQPQNILYCITWMDLIGNEWCGDVILTMQSIQLFL